MARPKKGGRAASKHHHPCIPCACWQPTQGSSVEAGCMCRCMFQKGGNVLLTGTTVWSGRGTLPLGGGRPRLQEDPLQVKTITPNNACCVLHLSRSASKITLAVNTCCVIQTFRSASILNSTCLLCLAPLQISVHDHLDNLSPAVFASLRICLAKATPTCPPNIFKGGRLLFACGTQESVARAEKTLETRSQQEYNLVPESLVKEWWPRGVLRASEREVSGPPSLPRFPEVAVLHARHWHCNPQ